MGANSHSGTLGTRVRRNIKDLSPAEWNNFVNALKVLKSRTRPGGVVSIYEEFSAMHMGAVEINRAWRRKHGVIDFHSVEKGPADPAHDNPGFLPWHRQFLLEFESALQAIDPSVTLPYWDWTDHEFTKKLFSPAMMGSNGGHNGTGGAVINGPFSLQEGWSCNPALHRPSWLRPVPQRQAETESKIGIVHNQQPSLGRSIVRYLGDFEDLATAEDVVEFTKRKSVFGPDKLVVRAYAVTDKCPSGGAQSASVVSLPQGTIHIGEALPLSAVQSLYPCSESSLGSHDSWTSWDDALEMADGTDTLLSPREVSAGFRWSIEGGPHMHNQTHDWFGFHTTILQDDRIVGASTMPNVACATADPVFFLHHCNIDRLWAEWQDSGHYGSIFFPKRQDPLWLYRDIEAVKEDLPMRRYIYPQGHNLDDAMWPWNNELIQTQKEIQEMIPLFPYTVTPNDTLDYRLLGYRYDTSTEFAVNNVKPVLVHLPLTSNELTHQVFPLDIQRSGRYLVAAKNTGANHAHLSIQMFPKYERIFEQTFMQQGFRGESIHPELDKDEKNASTSCVWRLERGRYFVVVSAIVLDEGEAIPGKKFTSATYEIGVATSLDFDIPIVPIEPGVISNPQIPQESCIYIANRRYAPIKLEVGRPQFRLTQMKGTHELFGINVYQGTGAIDVKFEGMDALVQLYGPFDLDNDRLPHFDIDGKPIQGDTLTQLNSRVQIASSEGCCKRLDSGIFSLVTPGRYIVLVFHCSIGHHENQPYKVSYNFESKAKIRELELDRVDVVMPGASRAVNELYHVSGKNGLPFVTQSREMFKVDVVADDAKTQKQVRIAVFTYSSGDILGREGSDTERYVSYNEAFWGSETVTFAAMEGQLLFIRVSILNGHHPTKVSTSIRKW